MLITNVWNGQGTSRRQINTSYKIIEPHPVQRRLVKATEYTVEQLQCGFIRGKSTVDAIHIVKQLMEKVHQHKLKYDYFLYISYKLSMALKEINLKKTLKELRVHKIKNTDKDDHESNSGKR